MKILFVYFSNPLMSEQVQRFTFIPPEPRWDFNPNPPRPLRRVGIDEYEEAMRNLRARFFGSETS